MSACGRLWWGRPAVRRHLLGDDLKTSGNSSHRLLVTAPHLLHVLGQPEVITFTLLCVVLCAFAFGFGLLSRLVGLAKCFR